MQRGKITNYDRARQQIDMSGLRWGMITPTDIDMMIEYHGTHYILGEFKHVSAEAIQHGQRLAFERLADDLRKSKPTLLFIAQHDTLPHQDIDGANAIVTNIHEHQSIWKNGDGRTVKETIDEFLGIKCPKISQKFTSTGDLF